MRPGLEKRLEELERRLRGRTRPQPEHVVVDVTAWLEEVQHRYRDAEESAGDEAQVELIRMVERREPWPPGPEGRGVLIVVSCPSSLDEPEPEPEPHGRQSMPPPSTPETRQRTVVPRTGAQMHSCPGR